MNEGGTSSYAEHATERKVAGLTIQVVNGIGFGPTKLAAFDAALREAGIANHNIIHLSSIIPPMSTIVSTTGKATPVGAWGDRLYTVMADLRVDTRYEEAVAGIGWVQEPETKRGLFVEHVGHTEREVRRDIIATLEALCAGRPETSFGTPDLVVRNTVCAGEPTCALVAAVFEAEPWQGDREITLP
ncbi:MAG: pyruvoyl-dependent arginine decarboxylase [Acidimicrobiia bacterium]